MTAPVITTPVPQHRLSAVTLYNQGVEAIKVNADNTALAWQLICSSVEHDPSLAVAWQQIGQLNWQQKNLAASIAALRRLIELPIGQLPGDMTELMLVQALGDMGHRLFHAGRVKESREFVEASIKRDPTHHGAWCALSLIESWDGNNAKAIEYAEKAFRMSPEGINETALAFACLYDRQYARGLKHFEARFEYKLPQFLSYPYPKWTGEDLTGKTLFIVTDQGLGDSISFMRFVPMAAERAGQVLLIVQPELVRFASACLQAWPNVAVIPANTPFPVADYWTTPMSLPVPLGLTDQQIIDAPPLTVPEFFHIPHWKTKE